VRHLHELVNAFGLNPAKLPIEIVQRDIPFGGLCFTIRVPDDIRIICTPKEGYPYFRTVFHEYGHALHAAFNRQSNYFFKREWGAFNEGMAETLAYFTHHDEWLRQLTNYEAAQIAHYQREYSIRRILRLRNLIAQARFEIEAYDNPGADLDRLIAEYEARYLLIPVNLTPRWAAVSFPTTHPIYRQNYLIADLIAAQTHAAIKEQFGAFFQLPADGKAAVFSFLRENYFTSGAALDWTEKIRRATGQPLKADALVAELGL
jgi:peptidyl-dipeptidase A